MTSGDAARGGGQGKMDAVQKARFEHLALPHLDRLHRFACTLTRNSVEADDLLQETFVRAFRGFGSFELREFGARPWLMRIMYNAYYSSIGRRRHEPTLAKDFDFDHLAEELTDGPAEPMTAADLNWEYFDEELKQAVEELQVEYQTVLLLWALDRLTYSEIAKVCDCPVGTVMSRLYRARRFLSRRLASYVRDRKLQTERKTR